MHSKLKIYRRKCYTFTNTNSIFSDLNPVSRWLDVLGTAEHKICTLPMNVIFADVSCDLDFKLVVGDMGLTTNVPKLKVIFFFQKV